MTWTTGSSSAAPPPPPVRSLRLKLGVFRTLPNATDEGDSVVVAATGRARTAGRTSPHVSAESDNVRHTNSADPSSRRHVLLTTEVAAEYLAVSVRTIKNLLCDGKLPYVKVGRATRIDTADIDEYIERNRRRNRQPPRGIT